jgi:hypothetical protein
VASTLRLPAMFLGGKTFCAFDCTPNVDTATEDKKNMEAKATRQATHVIPAYRKESLFFLQKNGQRPSTNYASSLNGFKMG